jgi:hypothetical protein
MLPGILRRVNARTVYGVPVCRPINFSYSHVTVGRDKLSRIETLGGTFETRSATQLQIETDGILFPRFTRICCCHLQVYTMILRSLTLTINLGQSSPKVLLPAVNVLPRCLKNASHVSFLASVATAEGRASTRVQYGDEHCCIRSPESAALNQRTKYVNTRNLHYVSVLWVFQSSESKFLIFRLRFVSNKKTPWL